jgi:hypothetical protein
MSVNRGSRSLSTSSALLRTSGDCETRTMSPLLSKLQRVAVSRGRIASCPGVTLPLVRPAWSVRSSVSAAP